MQNKFYADCETYANTTIGNCADILLSLLINPCSFTCSWRMFALAATTAQCRAYVAWIFLPKRSLKSPVPRPIDHWIIVSNFQIVISILGNTMYSWSYGIFFIRPIDDLKWLINAIHLQSMMLTLVQRFKGVIWEWVSKTISVKMWSRSTTMDFERNFWRYKWSLFHHKLTKNNPSGMILAFSAWNSISDIQDVSKKIHQS